MVIPLLANQYLTTMLFVVAMGIGGHQIFRGLQIFKLSARISYCSFRQCTRVKQISAQLGGLQPSCSPPPTRMVVTTRTNDLTILNYYLITRN